MVSSRYNIANRRWTRRQAANRCSQEHPDCILDALSAPQRRPVSCRHAANPRLQSRAMGKLDCETLALHSVQRGSEDMSWTTIRADRNKSAILHCSPPPPPLIPKYLVDRPQEAQSSLLTIFCFLRTGYTVIRVLQRYKRIINFSSVETPRIRGKVVLSPVDGVKVGFVEA